MWSFFLVSRLPFSSLRISIFMPFYPVARTAVIPGRSTSIYGKITTGWKSKNAIFFCSFELYNCSFLRNIENLVGYLDAPSATSRTALSVSELLQSYHNWKFKKVNWTRNTLIFLQIQLNFQLISIFWTSIWLVGHLYMFWSFWFFIDYFRAIFTIFNVFLEKSSITCRYFA